MKFVLLVLVALVACGDDSTPPPDAGDDGGGEDVPRGPVPFSVATWNVENLFDEVDDPEKLDELPSSRAVEGKLEALGRVIRALDADIVALQEVENEAILNRLADGPLADMGYTERHLIDGFDRRGIDVACLSRVPITNVVSHQGESFPAADGSRDFFFTRDALEIFAEPGGVPIIVMILHLRSMLDDGDDHRLAEAIQARRIADRRVEMGFDRFLIVGDFNDLPGSEVLDAIVDDEAFIDQSLTVPVDDRWTFDFRGRLQLVDYIVGSPLMDAARDDALIVHGPEVDAASDHAPVRVSFEL
ncbi:MAG: endonuclease/exonuclease/phosphatase family protein [Myxococcota bacterium]